MPKSRPYKNSDYSHLNEEKMHKDSPVPPRKMMKKKAAVKKLKKKKGY
jgi:hypothetical protein